MWNSACGGFSEPRAFTLKWLEFVGTVLNFSQSEFQTRGYLGMHDAGRHSCDDSEGQRGR